MSTFTGYYQGGGSLFDHGEAPSCHYCHTEADPSKDITIFATDTSGISVCHDEDCMVDHCSTQFETIDHTDDGKGTCKSCGRVETVEDKDNWECKECSTHEDAVRSDYVIGESTCTGIGGIYVLVAIEDPNRMSRSYTDTRTDFYTYGQGNAYLWVKQSTNNNEVNE